LTADSNKADAVQFAALDYKARFDRKMNAWEIGALGLTLRRLSSVYMQCSTSVSRPTARNDLFISFFRHAQLNPPGFSAGQTSLLRPPECQRKIMTYRWNRPPPSALEPSAERGLQSLKR
jgi:hypothetical protein